MAAARGGAGRPNRAAALHCRAELAIGVEEVTIAAGTRLAAYGPVPGRQRRPNSFHEKAGESQGGLVFTYVDSLPLS